MTAAVADVEPAVLTPRERRSEARALAQARARTHPSILRARARVLRSQGITNEAISRVLLAEFPAWVRRPQEFGTVGQRGRPTMTPFAVACLLGDYHTHVVMR